MTLDRNQIYNLLPAVYRIRDAQLALQSGSGLDPSDFAALQQLLTAPQPLTKLQQENLSDLQAKQQRGPLQSLIEILAEQIEVLQDNLVQSYDDLFIETCADWAVPYIGALVGLKGLTDVPSAGYTVRAAVADAIENRRAKGTVPALEAIAREVTDWDANVVEYFQVLATTQFTNHIRPSNLSVANIRSADHALLNTPFDSYARTAEMRNIETRLGKYNIPNIGIFLWRLQQQKIESSPAFTVDGFRYCFDPLGKSVPLFTCSQPESPEPVRATPYNVAMPIIRWMLADDLRGAAQYYGSGTYASIDLSWQGGPPAGTKICACNLSDVYDSSNNVIGWAHQPQKVIGIDPQLGRIVFPSAFPAPTGVMTSWCYGFSSEIGGGPYARTFTAPANVSVPADAPTISDALALALPMLSSQPSVVIEITDNGYYVETPSFAVPDNRSVQIRAADGNRPTVILSGDWVVTVGDETTVSFDGLLIAGGSLSIQQNTSADTVTLQISHCTFNPATTPSIGGAPAQPPLPSLWIEPGNVAVQVDHSILGAIRVGSGSTVSLTTCIVDALSPSEVAYACYLDATSAGCPLTVVNSTIIGKVHTEQMALASDSIFFAELAPLDLWTAPIIADQLQQGCVRFCYVPPGSVVPRVFHCYPVSGQASTPEFTSLRFGDPGYCQLTDRSGLILSGADDQSEIGVFHDVYAPQRLANLNVMLSDYLRFGMEAGVFFAT
jgi:Phage tail protein (Tail_P2_I)